MEVRSINNYQAGWTEPPCTEAINLQILGAGTNAVVGCYIHVGLWEADHCWKQDAGLSGPLVQLSRVLLEYF